jgi:hypothetical protein
MTHAQNPARSQILEATERDNARIMKDLGALVQAAFDGGTVKLTQRAFARKRVQDYFVNGVLVVFEMVTGPG